AVVLPAFWRPRDWRLPLGLAVTLVACYLPYLSVGWRVLGFLRGYLAEERIEDGHGIFLLQVLGRLMPLPEWTAMVYFALVRSLLCLLAARFAFATPLPESIGARVTTQAHQAIILGAIVLTALSPHYPWYFGWLAPLACLAPVPAVLWLLAA